MDMKNAFAVCLISLFSATLVVLIARSLDSQAASRIEPQLANIVEELRAIRSQGRMSVSTSNSPRTEAINDGLVVYYFHGNIRCPTCQSIESQSHEAVKKHFAAQLEDGTLAWKILNYEQPTAKPLATKFDVHMPVVVLARMKEGQVKDWKRLDEVWGLVGDKPAFAKFVQGEIDRMLSPEKQKPSATDRKPKSPATQIPVPQKKAPSIPVPQR
ncbi:MAG: nitrophenyl compound nitroreductase subunit ArsF family protein [Thermoguttaceae bacterium]